MWRSKVELSPAQLQRFETRFSFRFCESLQSFLLDNNGGRPSSGLFPTSVRDRVIESILDFGDEETENGAWAVNARLRKMLGDQRIIIGKDTLNNYICVERNYKQQSIVVWNHITNNFEECLWPLPMFLRHIS